MSDEKEAAKSAKELKIEFTAKRQQELAGYNQELMAWLQERHIDLDATITSGNGGNSVEIQIIDRL